MPTEGTFTPIDATGRSYVAHIGDTDITFTRALSARQELDLERVRAQTAEEGIATLLALLAHMAPGHNGEIDGLMDRLGSRDIVRLVGAAALELRAVPFTEPRGSSPPAVTVGATGADEPTSPTSTT